MKLLFLLISTSVGFSSPVSAAKPVPTSTQKPMAKKEVPSIETLVERMKLPNRRELPAALPKPTTRKVEQKKIPAPAPAPALVPAPVIPPPQEVSAESNGEEETIDLSEDVESSFNPYLFQRDSRWMILPLFTLLFLGLHLLPIPKRKGSKKIHAEQFLGQLKGAPQAPPLQPKNPVKESKT
jgi:hypothetical protein